MIGYLQGQLFAETPEEGKWIITVGGTESCVGYQVYVPHTLEAYSGRPLGQAVKLFIHTHIREDQFDLYGFLSQEEKATFLLLLNVNGIGPKSALSILSKVGASLLIQAILQESAELLQTVPGIGKKTAEKIVLELRDPMKKRLELAQWARNKTSLDPTLSSSPPLPLSHASKKRKPFTLLEDARGALIGLGYREGEIDRFLERILLAPESHSLSVEEMIRRALKELSPSHGPF